MLGDWNGFAWEDAQTQLTDPAKGGVLTDLATALLAPEERYSYLFDGNMRRRWTISWSPAGCWPRRNMTRST